ncbi:MAG TPA: 4-hydroxythreonine-4-phosphate dehydrogenase PdxA [Xanthobacteraceae bacterium]|nr:4-hydroxythreonine-4-phosphate dehydrogenase PdxA [Xanthobacteraceae bacterium]
MPNQLPRVAIATGDPAGIGPEVGLKAALDPAVNAICQPIVVGDPEVVARHARGAGLPDKFHVISQVKEARWPGLVNLLNAPMPNVETFEFGKNGAAYGLGALASARVAIHAALANEVDAVVAAPQNETSVHAAGIEFDGYPSFVAKETSTDKDDVYLMLCFGERRIVHTTLHVGVAEAVRMITRERVGRVIRAANTALKRLGIASPKIFVSGLNPHAGEGGLFGREEIEIISPAIADTAATGIDVTGPFGADTMFHKKGCDAFIVMLHDQGHITAKLLAPNATAGLAIGTPIMFSSVAHGSAFDIAGKGQASPAAMIEAIKRLVGAPAKAAAA